MAFSKVSISNDALAELREPSVQAMDENSFQARECTRQYDQVLSELLEAHEWGFAGKRVALAAVANDRDAEWGYAYAMPEGVGTPRRVIPVWEASSGYVGNPLATWDGYTRWPVLSQIGASYVIEGTTIYSWIEDAILEYGASDISPAQMSALFRRALALGMAERMAITLKDKMDLQQAIGRKAEIAVQRAIADDKNRQPNMEMVDEVGAARQGYSSAAYPSLG